MFSDGVIEGGRDLLRKGRGAARLTIDMDAEQFGRRRQLAAILNHHEMHKVKTLFRAAECPGANLDQLSLAELDKIPGVLL